MVRNRRSFSFVLTTLLACGSASVTTTTLAGSNACGNDCVYNDDSCTAYEFENDQKPFLPELQPFTLETCDWTGEVGMAIRYRYLQEDNRLRPGGPGYSGYSQWRWNPHVSLTYKDTITGYIEGIDASTFNEELPILPIDENRWDMLQYYVDVKLMELGDGEVHARYGRQTLLYGDQHVISPLGWANTYRNFEGFKAYYEGDTWKVDAFAVQPVNDAARGTFPPQQVNTFDTPDQSEWVSGVYATYGGLERGKLDLYWIWDIETSPQLIGRTETDIPLVLVTTARKPLPDAAKRWSAPGSMMFRGPLSSVKTTSSVVAMTWTYSLDSSTLKLVTRGTT